MLQGIGLAVAIACGVSVPIGLLLGLAARLFAVKTDERLQAVREALPGNNCGGCGYAGCDALAEAVVRGDAPANACPVGGAAVAARIAEIMGTAAGDVQLRVGVLRPWHVRDGLPGGRHPAGRRHRRRRCRQMHLLRAVRRRLSAAHHRHAAGQRQDRGALLVPRVRQGGQGRVFRRLHRLRDLPTRLPARCDPRDRRAGPRRSRKMHRLRQMCGKMPGQDHPRAAPGGDGAGELTRCRSFFQ